VIIVIVAIVLAMTVPVCPGNARRCHGNGKEH
jgi:hypothetical protein